MKYYWNYNSEEAYREGKHDYEYGRSHNFDYDKWSDKERDRAYFDGQKDAEQERRDRERREEEEWEYRLEMKRQYRAEIQRQIDEERYWEERYEAEQGEQEEETENPELLAGEPTETLISDGELKKVQ